MGDFYRGHGGGAGGGGRRPPKRRYRDDSREDDGPRRSRYNEREDMLAKLRRETLTLAESPLVKIEDAVKNIATSLTSNWENEELREGFFVTLQALVVEQPFKIPFVATVILVANSQSAEVGKYVVEEFQKSAQNYLEAGDFTSFKLVLRFLGCLHGMLDDRGVLPNLEKLVLAVEAFHASGETGLALEILKIVLITIPYILASPKNDTEAVKELLSKTEPLSRITHPMQSLLNTFTGEAVPYDLRVKGIHAVRILQLNLQSYLDSEAKGSEIKSEVKSETESEVKSEIKNEHKGVAVLPRPWESFEAELMDASKHALPEIAIPEQYPVDLTALQPDIYYSVFLDPAAESVPHAMDVASNILRDAITDTINILDCNRLSVSRYLIELDCFYSPKAFVKRATPFDRVKEMVAAAEEGTTWKPEDIAVDAIFSQLFKLSSPPHKLIYYHAILTEICKLAPAAIAPSLGRAIRFMFRNLETMDTELIYRFVDWFSHHLSNFGFTWKWAEWNDNLTLPDVHPKKSFILGALEKEIRLSFATRIKGTLPDAYTELISEAKEKEQPHFKYDTEDELFSAEGKAFLQALAARKEDSEIEPLLAAITTSAIEHSLPDPPKYAREIYVTSICHIGAKSLSHVLSCIERCKVKLLSIGAEAPDARRQIIASVLGYWKDQPGIGANVVDKLLNYSIVTPLSVIEYVLYDAGVNALSETHAWEMVSTTINKVNNRVKQIAASRPIGGADAGFTEEQLALYDETLKGAEVEQGILLKVVTTALKEKAEGSSEEVVDIEAQAWMQWWARGWLRAFCRKFGVEEGKIGAGSSSSGGGGGGAEVPARAVEGDEVKMEDL